MNSEAAKLLASALEGDASDQDRGRYNAIGERWDDIYAEILPIEDDINNPIYGLAFRFWDDWGDAANHDWQYHEPTTREMWPEYAKEIASALREGKMPSNENIIDQFLPKPKEGLVAKAKKLWSKNA